VPENNTLCLQAAPHIEEAADQAGEAIQGAAHTVATNVEPAVQQATDFAQKKVGLGILDTAA